MDSKVDFLVKEGFFEFLGKYAFAADLGKRRLLEFVAGGLDDDDFGVNSGGLEDFLADKFGLPFGEHAAASTDSNRFH
jgi:hypothetical protein